MLLSESSPLLPGLPFALFTQSMDYVPLALTRQSIPPGLELRKYHLISDLEDLQQELNQVRLLGVGAAEEWLKGLSNRGKEAVADAERFEQWDARGGPRHASILLATCRGKVEPGPIKTLPGRPPATALVYQDTYQSISTSSVLPPLPSYGLAPGVEPRSRMPERQSDSISIDSQHSAGMSKPTKTSRERARIRAYKKADIIERCAKLQPPISRDMLERLEAFDAALTIPLPLNDSSWEILKERLRQERHKTALEDEARNAVRVAPIPGQFLPPSRTEEFLLANAGTPKREKLCKIAEEYIKQKWGYGGWVTYPNSPQFAADVLMHTRQSYMDEQTQVQTARESSGFISFAPTEEDTLKLEDMKWVFEQTIKPRTEQIRRELFVCPECPTAGHVKHFAFESIIQHFASKHTSAFSKGTQMVTWKAAWPERPPFHLHPERVHTPEPSITHTPTLSHKPLSIMSPGSHLTSTVPSTGWYTPDTMSLVSNTTHTYSVSGQSVNKGNATTAAPGVGMYEMQRDKFTAGLVHGWKQVPHDFRMPQSLQLYVTIASASTEFRTKYSNPPGLDLFRDCIDSKLDLRQIRDTDSLRCAECAREGRPEACASWILIDLVIHFKKAHLHHQSNDVGLDWKTEMVVLPEPALIKSLQDDLALLSEVRSHLGAAASTSTIQSINSNIPVLSSTQKHTAPAAAQYAQRGTQDAIQTIQQRPANRSGYTNTEFDGDYQIVPRRGFSSVAATYGDRTTARDSISSASWTIRNDNVIEPRTQAGPSVLSAEHVSVTGRDYSSYHASREQMASIRTPASDSLQLPEAEAMTRSNTVRSYHSRSTKGATDCAEDFLSTIDAHVDTEMANTGLGRAQSNRLSRPASRPGSGSGLHDGDHLIHRSRASQTTMPPRTQHNSMCLQRVDSQRPEHRNPAQADRFRFPPGYEPVQAAPMHRAPSRVIEFNDDGIPTSHTGRAWQEVSHPQRSANVLPTRGVDQVSAPAIPVAGRGSVSYRNERPGERRPYDDDGAFAQYPYQAVEHIPSPNYQSERIYDPSTGQYYVPERARVRQYIEIGDDYPRAHTLYDEQGRPVQYREVQEARPAGQSSVYERHRFEEDERNFAER